MAPTRIETLKETTQPIPIHVQKTLNVDSSRSAGDTIKLALSDRYILQAWKIGKTVLSKHDTPDLFPHFAMPGWPTYAYQDSSYWTSGFFPGILWLLYERSLRMDLGIPVQPLWEAAKKWETGMAKEQYSTNNHDLGFMIMPSFARDYDLTSDPEALKVIVNAAKSLSTRFDPKVGCIKSWDGARTNIYDFNNKDVDFCVVIDSMMNLELLYYASEKTGDLQYAEIATRHAETTLKNHVRENYSTYHLVNYNSQTGGIQHRVTNQGYDHESTWSRGQAWALYGYASCYQYTKKPEFLDAAKAIADYFLSRIDIDWIVWWDFDAPRPGVWDVSGGMCACSGMMLLQKLAPDRCQYLEPVLKILETTMAQATQTSGDCLLDRSTMTNYQHAINRTVEHGLVYADYYFLEVGNRLLEMGLVPRE